MINNENVVKFISFLKSEVANTIPKIVSEICIANYDTDEDAADYLKECKLCCVEDSEDYIKYVFLNEPSVLIIFESIANSYNDDIKYSIIISDIQETRSKYETTDFKLFINHWNNVVVPYFAYKNSLPEYKA